MCLVFPEVPRSLCIMYVLWFFLGVFGAHRFYTRNICTAFLYLFTGGGFGIGWIIDLCLNPVLVLRINELIAMRDNAMANAAQGKGNVVINVVGQPSYPVSQQQVVHYSTAQPGMPPPPPSGGVLPPPPISGSALPPPPLPSNAYQAPQLYQPPDNSALQLPPVPEYPSSGSGAAPKYYTPP